MSYDRLELIFTDKEDLPNRIISLIYNNLFCICNQNNYSVNFKNILEFVDGHNNTRFLEQSFVNFNHNLDLSTHTYMGPYIY